MVINKHTGWWLFTAVMVCFELTITMDAIQLLFINRHITYAISIEENQHSFKFRITNY